MVAWTNTKYAWSYEKQFHHYTKGENKTKQNKQTIREIEDSTIKNNYFSLVKQPEPSLPNRTPPERERSPRR